MRGEGLAVLRGEPFLIAIASHKKRPGGDQGALRNLLVLAHAHEFLGRNDAVVHDDIGARITATTISRGLPGIWQRQRPIPL